MKPINKIDFDLTLKATLGETQLRLRKLNFFAVYFLKSFSLQHTNKNISKQNFNLSKLKCSEFSLLKCFQPFLAW